MNIFSQGILMGRYKNFRETWVSDENCAKVRKLSECAHIWEESDQAIQEAEMASENEKKKAGNDKIKKGGNRAGWLSRHGGPDKKKKTAVATSESKKKKK
jgi:hypothetical protein